MGFFTTKQPFVERFFKKGPFTRGSAKPFRTSSVFSETKISADKNECCDDGCPGICNTYIADAVLGTLEPLPENYLLQFDGFYLRIRKWGTKGTGLDNIVALEEATLTQLTGRYVDADTGENINHLLDYSVAIPIGKGGCVMPRVSGADAISNFIPLEQSGKLPPGFYAIISIVAGYQTKVIYLDIPPGTSLIDYGSIPLEKIPPGFGEVVLLVSEIAVHEPTNTIVLTDVENSNLFQLENLTTGDTIPVQVNKGDVLISILVPAGAVIEPAFPPFNDGPWCFINLMPDAEAVLEGETIPIPMYITPIRPLLQAVIDLFGGEIEDPSLFPTDCKYLTVCEQGVPFLDEQRPTPFQLAGLPIPEAIPCVDGPLDLNIDIPYSNSSPGLHTVEYYYADAIGSYILVGSGTFVSAGGAGVGTVSFQVSAAHVAVIVNGSYPNPNQIFFRVKLTDPNTEIVYPDIVVPRPVPC